VPGLGLAPRRQGALITLFATTAKVPTLAAVSRRAGRFPRPPPAPAAVAAAVPAPAAPAPAYNRIDLKFFMIIIVGKL